MLAPGPLGYQLSIVELDLQLTWPLTDRLIGSTEFPFKGQKTQGGRSRRCNQAIPPERTESVDNLNEKGLDKQVGERPNHGRSSDALALIDLTFSAIWAFDNLIWLNNPT